ncbi:MAG: hypothetical protein A2W26_05270 [Acidobacteria bacterium RBG_16_64_8]|nr:MAG: hypothetical protein A2W26_05270 [Acidobacteria bacterium RBG_16_64_8]
MVRGNPSPGSRHPGPDLARRLAWWTLLVMVFLVPLAMSDFALPGLEDRLVFSSVDMVKMSLIRILALVALAAWAWSVLRKGGRIRHTPIDWLVLAWLAWAGIATITAVHWPTALLGTQGRYEGFLTFVTYGLIYFLTLQLADDDTRVLRLSQALFWSSVIVAVYGLLQYAGVVSLPEDLPWVETKRAFATYGNPSVLGGFLVFAVTVALGLALFERRRLWRMVYWTGFGLCGLALLVTFTRGAWIGGAVSLVLLAMIAWRQRAKLRRLDLIPAGMVGAVGIALIVRSLFDWHDVTNFGWRLASIFDFGSGEARFRTRIWQTAAAAIEDRPLFGWGPDTFGLVFSKFKPIEYVREAGSTSGADNAHDYPLHLASGVGILGAVLFFTIWIWAGVRSWKTVFARSGDPSRPLHSSRLLLGAFWAGSAGYLLHLLFGISVPGSSFLLWIALALVLVPTARQIAVKPRRAATVGAVAVLLAAALAIAGQGVVLAADRAYTTAREEFSPRPTAERYDAADRAVRLNPLATEHYSARAAVAQEQMAADNTALAHARQTEAGSSSEFDRLEASFAVTEKAYEKAIAFNPSDYANYVNLAAVYNFAGAVLDDSYYQEAVDTAQRGLEVMPYGTHVRLELTKALLAVGRTAEAAETLEYCMELEPAHGGAALSLAAIYMEQGLTAKALTLLRSVETLAPGQPGIGAAIEALEQGLPLP